MSKNMIWITGADGHVGTALHKVLPEHGYHVLCTNKEDVDVTDMDAVRLYAEMNRPTVIINCAALTNPSECEANPEEAYKVNAIGARNLATAAERLGAKLVQMSTDDVFDKESHIPYARCGSCIHRAGLWNPFDDGKSGNCSCDCDTGVYRYGRCAKCWSCNIGYGTELCRTSNRRYCIKSVDKQKRYR